MPKIINTKIGYVRIRLLSSGLWQLGYPIIRDGKRRYKRERIRAKSFVSVKRIAQRRNEQILSWIEGESRLSEKLKTWTVTDALKHTIKLSGANTKTREDYRSSANSFLSWLEKKHPEITIWGDLLPMHLQDYVRDMEKSLASSTVRRRFHPLRATARFMADNFEARDISRPVKLSPPKSPTEPRVLSISDMFALLEYIEGHAPYLYPIFVLQGLSGLRILEASNLREKDVDIKKGTIKIQKTHWHIPKSVYSIRGIPVLPDVIRILQEIIDTRTIRGPETFLFTPPRRTSPKRPRGAPWSESGLSHAMVRAVKHAYRDRKIASFKGFIPRWLRATFVTIAAQAGAREEYREKYIGHAPVKVMRRHYHSISVEDLRREICEKIQKYLKVEIAIKTGG